MNRTHLLLAALILPVGGSAQSVPRVPISETLRIGRVDDANYSFAGMNAVRPLADGRIAAIVWMPGKTELKVFDANGRAQWSRAFSSNEYASDLAVNGDTLAVRSGSYDEARLLLFIVGRDSPIKSLPWPTERGQTVSLLPSLSGPFVHAVTTTGVPDGQRINDIHRATLELRDDAKVLLTHVDSTPRALIAIPSPVGTMMRAAQLPWAERASVAAAGGRVFFTKGLEYVINVLDMTGKVQTRFAVPTQPAPISRAMQDEWFAAYRRGSQRSLYSDSGFAAIRALPSPPHRPIIGAMHASAKGELAIVRADRTASPVTQSDSVYVDILSREGVVRGSVALPPRARIHAFNGTDIFATLVDTTKIAGYSRERGATPFPLTQIVRFRIGAITQ